MSVRLKKRQVNKVESPRASEKGIVVWVDDFIHALSDLISSLESYGFEVYRYTSFSEVPEDIAGVNYFIFDNKIGRNTRAGSNFIKSRKFGRETKIILYSGYIDTDYYTNPIESIDNGAQLNHYLKGSHSGGASGSAAVAKDFADFFLNSKKQSLDENHFEKELPGTEMRFEDFMTLPFDLRVKFNEEFFEKYRKAIEGVFNSGAIWGLWFEGSEEPEYIAYETDKILLDEDVEHRARLRDQAPYVFRNDIQLDDTEAIRCASPKRNVLTYPVVAFDIDQQTRRMHFDTGSDTSFLNSKFISEINAETIGIDQNLLPKGSGRPVSARQLKGVDVVVDIFDAEQGGNWYRSRIGTKSVTLVGWSVANWKTGPFAISCGSECQKDGEAAADICQYRTDGLVGRSLPDENSLAYFVKKGQWGQRVVYFCSDEADEFNDIDN